MVIFEKRKFVSPVCQKKFASLVIFCTPPLNIKWPLPKQEDYMEYCPLAFYLLDLRRLVGLDTTL